MALLEARGIRAGYGELPVLHGVDIDVAQGETAVVLGLNGAGKTTLLLALAGMLPTPQSEVVFDGDRIERLDPVRRVERGIALVPEGRRVFPALSVDHNLRVGGWVHRGKRDLVDESLGQVFELFPRLRERRHQSAGTLSGGEQQMLAIGRALMPRPRLLLVDEASLGLAPVLVRERFDRIRAIADAGVGVLMVEQNVGVLRIADHVYVLEKGAIAFTGTREEVGGGEEIRRAYLGAA